MRGTVRRSILLFLLVAGVVLTSLRSWAASNGAEPVAHFHCAGYLSLAVDPNLSTLNKAFALPAAIRVRDLAVSRTAKLIADGLGFGTNPSASLAIAPLLTDVLDAESLGSFAPPKGGPVDFILALKLDANRLQSWRSNLSQITGVAGEKETVKGLDGWRWAVGKGDSFWMILANGWLVVGRGDSFGPVRDEYLQALKSSGRPVAALRENWLEADVDWVRMGACSPAWIQLLKPAQMKLNVKGENNGLKLTANLVYPQEINWKFDPRSKPVDLVQSPLVSFTTGQDLAAYLNMGPDFSALPGNPLTNQFCTWGLAHLPFDTYMAWPEINISNVLSVLSTDAPAIFNPFLKQHNGTSLDWVGDRGFLQLDNLRIMAPQIGALERTNGDFLVIEGFPFPDIKERAPATLWNQINGRTNLVYYDWEETGARLDQWRVLGSLILLPTRPSSSHIGKAWGPLIKWIGELVPLEGQTVTEITRPAPNELSLTRHGPFGLTGIEIFLLSDWLSAVGAPPHNPQPLSK